jgi:hypothetical protein
MPEQLLDVDRAEFVKRIACIVEMDGVGCMPVSIGYDGQELILTYGCVIRIAATGHWPEKALLSKAELKRFIKEHGPQNVNAFGKKTRRSLKRFFRVVGDLPSALQLARQDEKTLLIDGFPIQCTWSTAE